MTIVQYEVGRGEKRGETWTGDWGDVVPSMSDVSVPLARVRREDSVQGRPCPRSIDSVRSPDPSTVQGSRMCPRTPEPQSPRNESPVSRLAREPDGTRLATRDRGAVLDA